MALLFYGLGSADLPAIVIPMTRPESSGYLELCALVTRCLYMLRTDLLHRDGAIDTFLLTHNGTMYNSLHTE